MLGTIVWDQGEKCVSVCTPSCVSRTGVSCETDVESTLRLSLISRLNNSIVDIFYYVALQLHS